MKFVETYCWLTRIILILVSFFLFQSSTVAAFSNPINLGLNPHNPIYKTYTYDKIEDSIGVEVGLRRVLSENEVGSECEGLLFVVSSAAKRVTVLGKHPDYINLASKLNARRF